MGHLITNQFAQQQKVQQKREPGGFQRLKCWNKDRRKT